MSTYVCSDLHGQRKKFNKMLKMINFTANDKLYILGDVIDRGPDSIPLLLQIMEMENVICLLGNHEWMMFNSVVRNKEMNLWFKNGGRITYSQYIDLSDIDKQILIDYIASMPVVIPDLIVDERHFYLTHASYINEVIPSNNSIKILNNFPELIEQAVWDRLYPVKNIEKVKCYEKYKGSILIVGHTPTGSIIQSKKPQKILCSNKGHYIDIDCGCAGIPYGIKNARLGCLKLDNMQKLYF